MFIEMPKESADMIVKRFGEKANKTHWDDSVVFP